MPVLAILLGLGTWQWQRLEWKTALLARIAASEAGPPQPLTAAAPEDWSKVSATGRLRHDREVLLGISIRNGVMGAALLTPLERPGLPPLLVDRGWVPLERSAAIARPEGEIRITGYVRPSEARDAFAATDDPAGRRFYTMDIPAIGAALGMPGLAPYALVALLPEAPAPEAPGALPQPARALPRPPNNHLGYVITWYGLALSLLGVFAVWARRRLKDPEPR
nr:SURF1 family protein [Roseomonas sp. GC11]